MKIIPIHLWNHPPSPTFTIDELVIRSSDPVLAKIADERKKQHQQSQHQVQRLLDKIVLESRVIIIEGVSGSGKDTLQAYLKSKLAKRLVYDYSEGETLSSWKHFPIDGIFEVRLKFMQLFVNHMSNTLKRDNSVVFLLNRFHLSTYAWTIVQDKTLGKEYDRIINALKILPVHIFVLHLDSNEIATRSEHPERSDAWRRFQQQIVKNYTFCDRMQIQQKLTLEAANRQQIPYSVVKLCSDELPIADERMNVSQERGALSIRINPIDSGLIRRKGSAS